ncbi:hypothetical protein BCEN4_850016 [Burkholderia cenocepacia]|nr:hypothetical protein BCEN4_850016 [Burkholderia cenocepacia]
MSSNKYLPHWIIFADLLIRINSNFLQEIQYRTHLCRMNSIFRLLKAKQPFKIRILRHNT